MEPRQAGPPHLQQGHANQAADQLKLAQKGGLRLPRLSLHARVQRRGEAGAVIMRLEKACMSGSSACGAVRVLTSPPGQRIADCSMGARGVAKCAVTLCCLRRGWEGPHPCPGW